MLTVGEHPLPLAVILVQGSTADLVVPSAVALTAPVLEFATSRGAAASVTHPLVPESGEWVAHLTVAEVAALEVMAVARVKDGGRVLAAGGVEPNSGWDGRRRSQFVSEQLIWGGGGGGADLDWDAAIAILNGD